ncbi:(3R)-3-hydroxyacyl-CoA dehydrogenase-like [Dermacentor andersoni]|uniref:(3R)-3-hydroxyacyl-CoA dehydrogenase-like n=1 Tax=Dermacentor andersoni TaxID=34620 RepID=UPI002416AFA7|nr:estradiol 17-beta-dehydrogenase 8-like [Dermacentor andersoni]
MTLCGRLALVTGGTSGIGEAICHALAAEGATVIVAGRRLDVARKVVQSLPGEAKHTALYLDIGDASSVEKLFNSIRHASALPLSIVVNSAGIHVAVPLVDCTDELFDDIMRINLKGAFLVTRAAGREMIRTAKELHEGGASIVNISTIAAKGGWLNASAHAASKAGVIALTKSAAQELAEHGIRCNTVLPGWTDTPMTASLPDEQKAAVCSMAALKRAAHSREIAEAVKFLCSPTASSYVTGAALEVAGGLKM